MRPLAAILGLSCACVPAQSVQVTSAADEFQVHGATVRIEHRADGDCATVRRGGRAAVELPATDGRLHLRCGTFDPRTAAPVFAGGLAAPAEGRLFAVQVRTAILPEYRLALRDAGLDVVGYWPSDAFLVRGPRAKVDAVALQPWVRWTGDVLVGHKVDAIAAQAVMAAQLPPLLPAGPPAEWNLLLTDKGDRESLIDAIVASGGEVTLPNPGSVYLRARLSSSQLAAVAAMDSVLWVDCATPIERDLDNARIQGGANAIEFAGGFTGDGVRAQILEGLDQTHPDWALPPLLQYDASGDEHGHCTAMIVGGSGAGNTNARGILPDCQVIEASVFTWGGASRYAVTAAAVDPLQPWRAMQQTASWGYTATTDYTSASAELDDVLFDFDLPATQSQSNTGTTLSRPQAWAKNVISVGGVHHFDTVTTADDVWNHPGSTPASIGPASDGRIKPDICCYYEGIHCGDLPGSAGYSPTNYVTGFGGTSGATPIVNGYVGLIQEMFTDGVFGNPLPLPATPQNRFENRPHMTTAKALLCNTSASYSFFGTAHDLTRTHQGWGFPDVARLWNNRDRVVVVDEYEVLGQGQSRSWYVWIAPGTPTFRATMAYADPPALPSAAIHRVNSLDLRVERFADGVHWWGNNGLDVGNTSAPGGVANDRDTLEQVWLSAPAAGVYKVTVSAPTVVQDGHVETPELDVDFALVMHPMGGGYRAPSTVSLDLISDAPGDLRVQVTGVPATGWFEGFTFVSFDTGRPVGFGNLFGIEFDVVTDAVLSMPALNGDVFHFLNTPGTYPHSTFVVPPALARSLSGVTIDAVVTLFTDQAEVFLQSNVDRVTVQ